MASAAWQVRVRRASAACLAAFILASALAVAGSAASAGPARTIDCAPGSAAGTTGGQVEIACSVTDADGQPVQGASVAWGSSGVGSLVSTDPQSGPDGIARAKASSAAPGDQVVSAQLDPAKTDCQQPADTPKGAPPGVCSDSSKVQWTEGAKPSPTPSETTKPTPGETPKPTPTPTDPPVQAPPAPEPDGCKEGEPDVSVLDDPADVDAGVRSADVLELCLYQRPDGKRSTLAVLLRDTKPKPDESLDRRIFVFLDEDSDGAADYSFELHHVKKFQGTGTVWRLSSSSGDCHPLRSDDPLVTGPLQIREVTHGLRLFFAVPEIIGPDYFTWGALAVTADEPPPLDFVPEVIAPAYPSHAAMGDWDCEEQGAKGAALRLYRSEPFDGAIPRSVLVTHHGDSGHGISPPAGKNKFGSVPRNRPPRVKLAISDQAPRTGQPVRMNAGRSKDPEGKRLSFAWDLDADGDYDDGYGPKITYAPCAPTAQKVSVMAVDPRDRGTTRTVELDVGKRGSLDLQRFVRANAKPGDPTNGFGGGLGPYVTTGRAFASPIEKTAEVSADIPLGLKDTIGGSYGDALLPSGATGQWLTSAQMPPLRKIKGQTPGSARGASTGALVSPSFVPEGGYLVFKLGGTPDRERVKVELWAADPDGRFSPVKNSGRVPSGEGLEQVEIDLGPFAGVPVVLVASDTSCGGYLNLDEIEIADHLPREEQPPVVGFADPHVHLMAHQGFGGLQGIRSYMGVPGGNAEMYHRNPRSYDLDVNRDSDTHFGGPIARIIINVVEGRRRLQRGRWAEDVFAAIGSLIETEFHDDNDGPMHQQSHITEIRRAYEGGLRLISSLAVSSATFEYAMGKPYQRPGRGPGLDFFGAPRNDDGGDGQSVNVIDVTSDKDILEAHAVAVRQLAAANSDWMQVVYSPEEAYEAIRANKLAVVLGTEVDTLGNIGGALNSPSGPSRQFPSAQAEVDYLWNLGYRQVQLIHAVDNSIGGTALFQDGYNTANDFLHRPYKDATKLRVADSLNDDGWAFNAPPGVRRDYGYLLRPDVSKACQGRGAPEIVQRAPRGECVQWYFDKEQTLVSIDAGFRQIHPGAVKKRVDVYPYRYTEDGGADFPQGQINARGITDYGREYVRALMRRGMIIDMEHMSDKTFDALVDPGRSGPRGPVWDARPAGTPGCSVMDSYAQFGEQSDCFADAYPLMSSHTSFRGQSFFQGPRCTEHIPFGDLNPPDLRYCKTTFKGWVAREFERTPAQVEYIRRSGGIVAPVVGHDPVDSILDQRAPSADGPDWRLIPGRDRLPEFVPDNDCAGSSKSWIQAHLYAVSKMRGRGVALSTDMTMVGATKPRFRPSSWGRDAENPGSCSASLEAEQVTREESVNPGQYNRAGQRNPILYVPSYASTSELQAAGPRALRRYLRPDGTAASFNYEGLRTYGLLPELLQDARNVGVTEGDLAPLFLSAQHYIEMWRKAFGLAGCDEYETRGGCAGDDLMVLNERAVCRNTCPNDPGRGMDLDPAGRPFRFKPPFDR